MICRNCLPRAAAPAIWLPRARRGAQCRLFSLSAHANAAGPTSPPKTAAATTITTTTTTTMPPPPPPPPLSTPLSTPLDAASTLAGNETNASSSVLSPPAEPLSSCPAGTTLKGLNYHKGREDPIALPDDQYPPWLWTLLKTNEPGRAETKAGDEFSKSKKQRRLAAKTAREREEQLLAEGNYDALVPKIPLHHQSINLPGEEACEVAASLDAVDQREELRRAMRRERIAKIRGRNYLSTL